MYVPENYNFPTLPDYLREGLALVFVGINPGLYAVRHGHYFARRTNRFWPGFSRSRLSEPVRIAWGRQTLVPEDDARLLDFGIGFTDVVKLSSRNAAELPRVVFQEWAPRLLDRLAAYRPRVACFHGVTGYRAFLRYALHDQKLDMALGPQPRRLGPTQLYVVPNPSPANAHFRLADQIAWYDHLADFLEGIQETG